MLSVVIPNYNHARYLPTAIKALRSQDRLADEIIVVDDASTDDSLAVLERLGCGQGDVSVLVNETNRGAVLSLQRGLEAARGHYIYFGAADDVVLPGFFRAAMDTLAMHPDLGLFCGDARLIDGETGRVIGHRPAVRPMQRAGIMSAEATGHLLRRADNFILTGSAIFRRDLALAKGGFDQRAGSFADGLLARKIALAAGFCYRPQAMAVWNIFEHGLSRSSALELPRALKALTELPRLIAADEDFPSWYAPLLARRWRFATARLALATRPVRPDLLRAMGGVRGIDRAVIRAAEPAFNTTLGRWLMLAWLTLRLRPFRLYDVALTAANRWWEGWHNDTP